MSFGDEFLELATKGIRIGHNRSPEGEHSEPIYATSSYVFDSAEAAAMRFTGEDKGNVYSRYTNPTVAIFEKRLAAMEGAKMAVATASGMSAILSTCMALLTAGDHIVCSKSVFGTTIGLFNNYLGKFGIETTFVNATDEKGWEEAILPSTKLLFLETPSNPLCDVIDIQKMADLAHANNALLVVDNCFCTPVLQTPIALGADIVIHSATKYIDGQGRCLGGAVVGSESLMMEVLAFLRTAGPTMSAFNAWVCLKGLETLSIRMKAHSDNALAIAKWLSDQSVVDKVYYTGLPEHKGFELACKQQKGFSGMLSFSVTGDKEQAWQVIDATQMLSITANLGDAKTTIVHPATTTHGRLSDEQRMEAGIGNNLIRVSVGLEGVQDIINDLDRGLARIR